jgi:cytochrome P450
MSAPDEYVFPPTPELIACPWAAYTKLRESRPVYQAPGGEYVISRYEDLWPIYKNNAIFASRDRTGHTTKNFNEVPEPDHMERRRLLAPSVAPYPLQRYEPVARAFANELIDGFVDRGEVDFINEFAFPFSTYVVSGILGLDRRRDYDRLMRWGTGFEGSAKDYIGEERRTGSLDRWGEIYDYGREQIEERLAEPRDDLLTELIEARREKKGEVDVEAMGSDLGGFIAAGMHTTANMISDTMRMLLQHPDVMADVRADRSLIPAAIEETMRHQSPVQWNVRITQEDTEVGGVHIPAGSKLILVLAAANRDESMFENPDEFNPRRESLNKHLGFGQGPHFCLGAPTARLEGRIAFDVLFDRLEQIELDEENYVHGHHVEFNGPDKMPIRFVPARVPAPAS